MDTNFDKFTIKSEIDNVKFDFYNTEEVKKISIKPLTLSSVYTNLGQPIRGSLHDPAMGVSALDKIGNCETCGLNTENCPGHFGHIELSVPIYNPFMMNHMIKLLNAKCFNCHKLKMQQKEKNYIFFKILLIKLGLYPEAEELHSILYSTYMESTDELNERVATFLKNFQNDCTNIDMEECLAKAKEKAIEKNEIAREDRTASIDTQQSGTNTNDTNTSKKKKNKKTGTTHEYRQKIENKKNCNPNVQKRKT